MRFAPAPARKREPVFDRGTIIPGFSVGSRRKVTAIPMWDRFWKEPNGILRYLNPKGCSYMCDPSFQCFFLWDSRRYFRYDFRGLHGVVIQEMLVEASISLVHDSTVLKWCVCYECTLAVDWLFLVLCCDRKPHSGWRNSSNHNGNIPLLEYITIPCVPRVPVPLRTRPTREHNWNLDYLSNIIIVMPIVSYRLSAESSLITQVVEECKHETKSDHSLCSQGFGHGRRTWAENNSGDLVPNW